MLIRTAEERAADWFRLRANHLLCLIEAASEHAPGSAPDARTHDVQVMEDLVAIVELGEKINAGRVIVMDQVSRDSDGPAWMDGSEGWESIPDYMTVETYDGAISFWNRSFTARRFILRPGIEADQVGLDVDAAGEDWYHPEKLGTTLAAAVSSWIMIPEARLSHRTSDASGAITELDVAALAADATRLANRFEQWLESKAEPDREAVGSAIAPVWNRLRDGDVDLLEAPSEARVYLLDLWRAVEWSQRWVEIGLRGEAPYARSLQPPELLNLRELADGLTEVAKSLKLPKPGIDGMRAETYAGRSLTYNEKMFLEYVRRPEVVSAWTSRQWSEHLGCSEGTVREASVWRKLADERELAAAQRRADRRRR